jgi:hypothetical protein
MLSGNTMNYFVVILIVCRLNKNQPYVHLSEIDDESFGVSKGEKALNKQQPTKEERNCR